MAYEVERKFDKDTRFCIIGGGPAGLCMGMQLEKKGYKNYTILEKNNWVGGKCSSPKYKGRRYEMGAIMGVPSYYAVREAMDFSGMTHGGPKLVRMFHRANGEKYDPETASTPEEGKHLMELQEQIKKLGYILETKYRGYDVNGHRGVADGKFDGFDAYNRGIWMTGENPNLKDLALPFKEFCELNEVPLVQEVWILPYTSFGYGFFDEIPAAYVLKYLDFQTESNFIRGNLWTWTEGTQSIWENLNYALYNSARLNSDITKVERKDDKVYVTVNGKVEEYDKIIVTSPLQYLPDYFDATPEEKELFSKIDYERYDVMAMTLKPGTHRPELDFFVPENMIPSRLGHIMVSYNRWKDIDDQVITTYTIRNHSKMGMISEEEAQKYMLEDMKLCGYEVDEIINEESWYYFPHVTPEVYRSGWYDKVEAMQGNLNTYYAGEVMSFGDMDETTQYSKELAHRFF